MSQVCRVLSTIMDSFRGYLPPGEDPLAVQRWWGRRYHKLVRGMVVAAFSASEDDIDDLAVYEDAVKGQVILDPFAGYGSTVVEAARLGATPIGIDTNPMAWWIMHSRLLCVDLDALDSEVTSLIATCKAKLAHLFETTCPICDVGVPAKSYLWSNVVDCSECHHKVRLLPGRHIREHKGRVVHYCQICDISVETTKRKITLCPSCGTDHLVTGSVRRGELTCPFCLSTQTWPDQSAAMEHIAREPFLTELHCPEHGLQLKPLDTEDKALHSRLGEMLDQHRQELLLPDTHLSEASYRLRRYGRRYVDFLSPRQQLSLGLLLKTISEQSDRSIRDTMLSLFVNVLDYNTLLCGYNPMRGASSSWDMTAAVVPPISAETNPWNDTNSGSVAKLYSQRVRPAKQQIASRTNATGGVDPYPEITQVDNYEALGPGTAMLRCASPLDLPLPANSVDAVVTMPPFFDNIPYTELTNFSYVWLRQVLGKEDPHFAPELITSGIEIQPFRSSVGLHRKELENAYTNNLKTAFLEISRVLKPDAPFVLLYMVQSFEMLKTTLRWLLDAGFYVADYCPLPTGERAFTQSTSLGWFTANSVFVCYKRGGARRVAWKTFEDRLLTEIDAAFSRMSGASDDRLAEVIWGTFIRHFSRSYPNIIKDDGTNLSIGEAVDWLTGLAGITPSSEIDIRRMADVQSIRSQIASGRFSEEEVADLNKQLVTSLRSAISIRAKDKVEAALRSMLGADVWDSLEDSSREFVVAAETLYRYSDGKDLDFGPIAVAFTKPLESELRRKFCRHLEEYAHSHGLRQTALKAGNQSIPWDRMKDGDVLLGQVEWLLRQISRPENKAVEQYIRGGLPTDIATYAEHELPDVIKEFREEGRNAGAHIGQVKQLEVEGLRSKVVGHSNHTRYWVSL
jgi:putative DNA methylase